MTDNTGNIPLTTITIPTATYDVLKKWASVSRSIGGAIELLQKLASIQDEGLEVIADDDNCLDCITEEAEYNIQELEELQQVLDNCNAACKEQYFSTGV